MRISPTCVQDLSTPRQKASFSGVCFFGGCSQHEFEPVSDVAYDAEVLPSRYNLDSVEHGADEDAGEEQDDEMKQVEEVQHEAMQSADSAVSQKQPMAGAAGGEAGMKHEQKTKQ